MLHKNQWKVFKLFKVEISQFLGVVDKNGLRDKINMNL